MFRKIGTALRKKESSLKDQRIKTAGMKAVFGPLLERILKVRPEETGISAEYSALREELVIMTPNKTTANELSLRLDELTQAAQKADLHIRRIIIR